jgi:hypothetical protein
MIEITMSGKNMEDCVEQVGQSLMKFILTDDLATELRARLAPQGLEVIIRKTDAPEDSPGASVGAEPPKRGPGRPRKVVDAEAHFNEVAAKELDAPKAANTNGKATAEKVVVTREEVIAALNAYAEANGGQAAGREVMKKVCGVTRLVDCTPDSYPKLIAALGA